MKRNFEKIKLNKFSNAELEQRKLNALKGGCVCGNLGCYNCSCGSFQLLYAETQSYGTADRPYTYVY